MPTIITYPLAGEPVRPTSGVLGRIEGVEAIEDGGTVLANVAISGTRALLAVPIAWDATRGEWSERVELPEPPASVRSPAPAPRG